MKADQSSGRREFLSTSAKVAAACTLFGTVSGIASAQNQPTMSSDITRITDSHYYLDDVLLETGFNFRDTTVIGTKTALQTVEIDQGKIVAILPNKQHVNHQLNAYNAQGKLMLPAFRDMHIHLDKTFYGGPWQAPQSREGKTIMDMITLEQKLLPELQPFTEERANALITLIQSHGSTIARSHCNIEPVSGLKNLETLQKVLNEHQQDLTCEIVAFPQHGLLLSKSEPLMREAMQAGAHYVGGLDPTNVDGAMEKSLDTMFQIALDYNKGVDIHLHETSPAGFAAIEYMIKTVNENPSLRGKVTISHAFALATLSPEQAEKTARQLAEQQITIASTVPIGTLHMPLKILNNNGVFVMTGTDSVIDHWSPFGLGDMLEKANLYAQLYTRPDELALSRALAIATGNILPLDTKGQQIWPTKGDDASFVLVDASCSAEAVARISPRHASFHKGKLAYGTMQKSIA
ncbi:amidohydrolase family protein [Providencia rettgeri]|uniref:amidohydrolase family protein n=1 Tax=Providencia rettgeri TaxID=587 RepID=UPI0010129DDA|nr:amidohydrolase family protein [Providencia rettgeri]ELR5227945.1 amidohydrolase family protein [Providencia rettgeri]MBQ0209144.1 amidohydrolase family protein [Providencia rettgeri]MBQ0439581.1 amidohydrolase family protein [Providencia rettgeri]MDR9615655.1 amidohydrolase family protein [Providencia rettgeri]NIH06751.1 amidohydrolase family protein [Providencia rettgeri]